MIALAVLAAELTEAQRRFLARVRRRPSMAVWFAVLFAGGIWTGLRIAELVQAVGLPAGFSIHAGTLVFLAFILALARGAVDGNRRTVRDRPLVFLWVQPVSERAIAWGKFLGILWTNLGLVTGTLVLVVFFVTFGRMAVGLPPLLGPAIVAAIVGGLATGFDLAAPAGKPELRDKLVGIAAITPLAAGAWFVTARETPGLAASLVALAVIAIAALALVPRSGLDVREAWEHQATGRSHRPTPGPRAIPGLSTAARAIFDKEWRTAWRNRDLLLPVAAIALTAIALPATYLTLGPADRLAQPLSLVLYPALAIAGVYLAASVTCAVGGLSALGRELGSLWVLRVAPVPGREVLAAKSAGTLTFAAPIVALLVLPLSVLAGLPAVLTGFLVAAATAVVFVTFAIGLVAGARDPAFDADTGGLPDSITLYNVFLLSLVAAGAAVGSAVGVYRIDRILGLFAAILIADGAALVAWAAARYAARRFDRLEVTA